MCKALRSVLAILLISVSASSADTFVHRQTGELLHGYATQQAVGNKTLVHTHQKGPQYLDLAEYDVQPDRLGRHNSVIVISIKEAILLEIETQAIENAIIEASNQGPLFILLEIDTPGGRVDFAKRICAAIISTDNCPIIAYISGGKHGGAFSAGVAVALACNSIYIAPDAAIGAATPVADTGSGPGELEKAFGQKVGEKIMSAWRAYLAALAEQNKRPGLVAMAMVDKDIEVIEVDQDGRRLFVAPANKRPAHQVVHTWSAKDTLVTLTATDAVSCTIVDKVVASQKQLLRELDTGSAKLVYETAPQQARKTHEKVMARFQKLTTSLDYHRKQLKEVKIRGRQLAILRRVISDYKSLIHIARNYPDVPVSVHVLQKDLNSAQAVYDGVRTKR